MQEAFTPNSKAPQHSLKKGKEQRHKGGRDQVGHIEFFHIPQVEGNEHQNGAAHHQCMIAVRENLMRQFGASVDDTILERVIRFGTADISERYLTAIQNTARDYTAGIFRRLREHEYDPELMRLYVVGGGSCMVKNFGEYDASRVMINDDICATAKGYELLSAQKMQKKGDLV